jgi:hypothetical protein
MLIIFKKGEWGSAASLEFPSSLEEERRMPDPDCKNERIMKLCRSELEFQLI